MLQIHLHSEFKTHRLKNMLLSLFLHAHLLYTVCCKDNFSQIRSPFCQMHNWQLNICSILSPEAVLKRWIEFKHYCETVVHDVMCNVGRMCSFQGACLVSLVHLRQWIMTTLTWMLAMQYGSWQFLENKAHSCGREQCSANWNFVT